jgi:hypothetical protein
MDKYYVIVAGQGSTSRANVEALIEDYVYANGNDVVFIFAYEKKPTSGQAFISQWAKDKAKDVVIFAHPDASYEGLSAATVNESKEPFRDAVSFLDKEDKAVGFILWSDDDQKSNDIVAIFNDRGVKCYDLTDGLNIINSQLVSEVAPVIPEAEQIDEEDEEDEDEEEDVFEELEELLEDEDEDEAFEDLYFGMQSFIKAIAREVAKELQKPSKGPQA